MGHGVVLCGGHRVVILTTDFAGYDQAEAGYGVVVSTGGSAA